jgi:hypothetical protein
MMPCVREKEPNGSADKEDQMAHTFKVELEVIVERIEGKFASRDEIAEAIQEALASAGEGESLSGIGADGNSEYEIISSTVIEVSDETPATKAKVG